MAGLVSDAKEIRSVFERLSAATNSGDPDKWSMVWDENGRLYAPQRPMLVGRAHIVLGSKRHLIEWKHATHVSNLKLLGRAKGTTTRIPNSAVGLEEVRCTSMGLTRDRDWGHRMRHIQA